MTCFVNRESNPLHLRRPALPGGDGEEGQEGPQHVVIMEVVLLPISGHGGYFVIVVFQELSSGRHDGINSAEWGQTGTAGWWGF